jgi:hypothetical protein
MSRESKFERHVIDRLHREFPGCFVVKNDAALTPGIPDRTVFYGDTWAMLEVKASANAPEKPNQGYYVDMFNRMSFAAFIYPENEEDVFHGLQQAFHPVTRGARFP